MSAPAPAWDAPLAACPLCGSAHIEEFDRDARGAHIARCRTCGLKFMNPQYTDAYLAEYYARYVTGELGARNVPDFRRAQKTQAFALIEQFVRPGRLLAIGCGDGTELRVARERGWRVEGYDVDRATTARVAREVGATIFSGDLVALPLPSAAYDCVYMDQVLEHPKQPTEHLRLAHRLLRPGGVLYVGTPNIESVSSRWKTALGKLGLKGRRRGRHYDSFHHLFYYSPRTLPRLLERRFGFRVLAVTGDPKPTPAGGGIARVRAALDRRFPMLDSTFVVVAAKG